MNDRRYPWSLMSYVEEAEYTQYMAHRIYEVWKSSAALIEAYPECPEKAKYLAKAEANMVGWASRS